jgi:hypothetical protein
LTAGRARVEDRGRDRKQVDVAIVERQQHRAAGKPRLAAKEGAELLGRDEPAAPAQKHVHLSLKLRGRDAVGREHWIAGEVGDRMVAEHEHRMPRRDAARGQHTAPVEQAASEEQPARRGREGRPFPLAAFRQAPSEPADRGGETRNPCERNQNPPGSQIP